MVARDDATPTPCTNGHSVPSGQAFCGSCGLPADRPGATRDPHDDIPRTGAQGRDPAITNRRRNVWLRVGIPIAAILAVAAIGIGIAFTRHGSGPDRERPDTATVPITPEEQCMSVVMDFLSQVPDAISEGYEDGVDASQIYTKYGMNSRVGQSILGLQPTLIANIMADGDPDRQLEAIKTQVHENCYDEFNYFDGGGLQGLE